jgi:hypothetical protein
MPIQSNTASGGEPEIDAEWMKFMSRITRQMNCDTVDDDSISDDGSDTGHAIMHNSASVVFIY